GVLSDAFKCLSRAYINSFQNKGKQIAIEMFLICFATFPYCPFLHSYASYCNNPTIFDTIHDSVRTALYTTR
ncbi:hypothetical protein EI94DRAFT_1599196, partial [Lactarius quietus]